MLIIKFGGGELIRNFILLFALFFPCLSFALSVDDQAVDYISLSRAAAAGDLISVKVLLKRGVNPNGIKNTAIGSDATYTASLHTPPIAEAAKIGNVEIVKLLLASGAEPNMCCCSCVTALHEAIIYKHKEIVKMLLKNGADPNMMYDGESTCIELAQKTGSKEIIKLINESVKK